jgi:hypothetical protein
MFYQETSFNRLFGQRLSTVRIVIALKQYKQYVNCLVGDKKKTEFFYQLSIIKIV